MEEEVICRVCRCEGTPEDPLFYPCLCSGSIKYIHQDCLVQWLQHSKKKYCELCNHPFTFSPIYDESMPKQLPKTVFFVGALQKMIALSKIWIRYCLVAFSWLIVVPYITMQIWNLYFGTPTEYTSELTAKKVLWDCFCGCFISGGVIVTFLGLMSLRDYIVSHTILREQIGRARDAQRPARRRLRAGVAQAEERQEGGEERDRRAGPAPELGNPEDEDDWADNIQYPDFRGWDEDAARHVGHENASPRAEQAAAQASDTSDDFTDWEGEREMNEDEEEEEEEGDFEDEDEDEFSDSDDEDADLEEEENAAAQDDQNGAANNGNGFGLLDGPHEDLSFEELIGLRGSIFGLFENLFWMILFNAVFLGTFGLLPFAIGDMILIIFQRVHEWMTGTLPLGDPLMGALNATLEKANSTEAAAGTHPLVGESALKSAVCISLGYMFFAACVFFYLGVSMMINSRENSFNRYLLRAGKFFLVFLKVTCFLVLELGVFPLMCGYAIKLATTDLFEAPSPSQPSLFESLPLLFLFLHWFIGNTFMFHVSSFVSLLRDILRPGVLWFLRNPNDPSFQPLREMIELPLMRHLRRIVISAIFYNSILVLTVWSVIKLTKYLVPSLFPLNFLLDDPLSELPLDLLVIHIALPFTFQRVHPGKLFVAGVKAWVRGVARLLCLSSYLLGEEHEDELIEGTVAAPLLNKDIVDLLSELDTAEEENNTTMIYCPPNFNLRRVALLVLFSISACIVNTTFFFGPVLLGRFFYSLFLHRPVHELYTFGMGICIIWTGILLAVWMADLFKEPRNVTATFAHQFKKLMRLAYLMLFIGIIIPLSIGIIIQLVLIHPIVAPYDQSTIFFLFQDWTCGVLQTKIIGRLILSAPDDFFLKARVEGLTRGGIENLDVSETFKNLFLPMTLALLAFILAPQALFNGLLPLFGVGPAWTSLLLRYGHLGLTLTFCGAWLLHSLARWISNLQQTIRDEKYLVGQRLRNLDRDQGPSSVPAPPPTQEALGDLFPAPRPIEVE